MDQVAYRNDIQALSKEFLILTDLDDVKFDNNQFPTPKSTARSLHSGGKRRETPLERYPFSVLLAKLAANATSSKIESILKSMLEKDRYKMKMISNITNGIACRIDFKTQEDADRVCRHFNQHRSLGGATRLIQT